MNYLSGKQVAEMLGVSFTSVHRLFKEGVIPKPIKVDTRNFKWLRNEVEEYLTARNLNRVA